MNYNNEESIDTLNEEKAIEKKEKHLVLFPLNVNNFIKVNELQEIYDPMFFSRANMPTAHGLLSNEIFGITKDDRSTIFAYIKLSGEVFLHPLAYKIWCKLDSNIKLCAYEMGTFKLDPKTAKLKEDPDGETGIKYLQKIIKDINFKRNESAKRGIRIDFLEKYRDKLFIENFVVIPAGYRDVNTDSDNRVGVGEVNKLYNAIIRDCKALSESDDYGLSLNGSLRGRIQDNIVAVYDWFVFGRYQGKDAPASGLSRKLGLIRRAGMKKSFDWGARLVICTQNLRKETMEDIEVDLDSFGLPIAALCANFFPYMLYYLRKWFENQFSDVETIMTVTDKGKIGQVHIKDWQSVYSDERLKEELDRFMHGMANRFIPIEAPVTDPTKEVAYLQFKGYNVPDSKIADEILTGKTDRLKFPIEERPLTWCDLIYRAAMDVTRDKMVLITRFPMDSYWNQFPAKIKVISTIETEPMIIGNTFYKEYPKIRMDDIGKNSTNKFVDVALPNNVRLGSIGGDFDGDTVSSKATYSVEANEELYRAVNDKKHYISMGCVNEMTTTNEGIQAIYDLTMVLPEDKSKLSQDIKLG